MSANLPDSEVIGSVDPAGAEHCSGWNFQSTAFRFVGRTTAFFRPPDIALMFGDGDDGLKPLLGLLRQIILLDFIHFFTDCLKRLSYLVTGQHDKLHLVGIDYYSDALRE
jgi:hypothetical protein